MLSSLLSRIQEQEEKIVYGVVRTRRAEQPGMPRKMQPAQITPTQRHQQHHDKEPSSVASGREQPVDGPAVVFSAECVSLDSNPHQNDGGDPVPGLGRISTRRTKAHRVSYDPRSSTSTSSRSKYSYRPHYVPSRAASDQQRKRKAISAYRVMTPAYRSTVASLPTKVYTPCYDPSQLRQQAMTPAYNPKSPAYTPKSPFYKAGTQSTTTGCAFKSPFYSSVAGMMGDATSPAYNPTSPFYTPGASNNESAKAYDSAPKSPYYAQKNVVTSPAFTSTTTSATSLEASLTTGKGAPTTASHHYTPASPAIPARAKTSSQEINPPSQITKRKRVRFDE